jgi:copper chaperone CopZ
MMKYAAVALVAVFTTAWAGDLKKVDLKVEGMHCGNCTERVKSAIEKVKNVKDVEVSLEGGIASVSLEEGSATTPAILAKAIAGVGFAASYDEQGETKTVSAVEVDHHDEDCDEEMAEGYHSDSKGGVKKECCKSKATKTEVKDKEE